MNLRLNISAKLTLLFVLFAALLLVVVGLLAYNSGRAALEAATISDLLSVAIEKEAALNAWGEDRQLDIATLAHSPDLLEDVTALTAGAPGSAAAQAAHDSLVRELQTWAGPEQQYLTLLVIEAENGRVIAATDPAEEGKFKENHLYFINGQNGPFVQNAYYPLAAQEPAMTAAAPFRSADGQLLGVLAGHLNLAEMNAIIQRRTGLHQTDDAFLVNTSNLFVTQPRFITDSAVLQRGIHTEATNRCLTHTSDVIFADDYRGVPVINVYRWLSERQLCLIVKLDQAEALAPSSAFGRTILLIGSLTLLAALILAVGLARTITQPVLALQTGAVRLGRGELDARLLETSNDELGHLAREFNTMAAALAEKDAQLRRHTEELEQIVEERTALLGASEERTRLIIESALDAVVTIDPESTITGWNPQAETVFGWSQQEALGHSLDIIIPAHHRDAHHRGIKHFLATGAGPILNQRFEITALRHNSTEFPVELTISPVQIGKSFIFSAFVRDITERQQAEAALRESEDRFSKAFHSSPAPMTIARQSGGVYIEVNESFLRMIECSREEVIGHTSLELNLIDAEGRAEIIRQVHQHETIQNIEVQAKAKSGRRLHVLTSIENIELAGEDCTITTMLDITERKQAEEQFRLVVEASPNAIVLVNTEGKISLVNARVEVLFGYGREELLGQLIEMLVPSQFRDHHNNYRDAFFSAPTARPMGAGRDLFGLRKDGSQVPIEIGLTPLTTTEGSFVLASIIDITERKRAETKVAESLRREQAARVEAETAQQRLAFLVEASNILAASLDYHATLAAVAKLAVPGVADWCAVDVVDPDGSLRRVAVVHTDPAKVALAYELQQRYPPDPDAPRGGYHVLRTSRPEFYPEITEALLEAAGADEEQLNIIRELGLKSAIVVPMLVRDRGLGTITFVSAESGRRYGETDLALSRELAGRAALAVDNARLYFETKKLNEELEQRVIERTTQLEAANHELEAFSYSVSHDLRAPLRSIDGFSQALLEDYAGSLDAEAQRYLQRVRAGSQRMAQLIDDLLMLSRLTRSEMRIETVNLGEITATIATNLRQMDPERQVEFIIAPDVKVQADARLIQVALENLLNNAWKFTAKHATACIEFGVLPQPDSQPAFFVRDDGAGFDMNYSDKLFGAFQRLHTPAEFSGMGIGLATVQRIIHRHGGRVWAEGVVEQGATFYFTM